MDKIKYDLVEGEIDPTDLTDVVKDFLKDPRCEGFDGLDAFEGEVLN